MSHQLAGEDKQSVKKTKLKDDQQYKDRSTEPNNHTYQILRLQQSIGNYAVQRLIDQQSDSGAFELEDNIANRINTELGKGQALDDGVQQTMSNQMGYDFSEVRVHTSPEASELSESLKAKAFTTGQNIFFKNGNYEPRSSTGQKLIAHELTHVVQQSSGQVNSRNNGMVVNPPDDIYEQEADAVAQQAASVEPTSEALSGNAIQREEFPEDDEELQMKADETIQREEFPEDDEELQMKADETIQREEMVEEEELD